MGTIQKQGLINTVIIYVGVALGLLNRVLVQPHYLTTNEIGLAGLLGTFSALLTTFLLLGTSSMCVRYFPMFRNREKRHHGFLGLVLVLPLLGSILGGIAIFILRSWLMQSYGENSPLFAHYFDWAFPLAVIMTFAIALNAYSNSLHKTTFPSFLNDIWVKVILMIGAIAYGLRFISIDWFVISIAIAYGSQLLFLIIYICIIDRPGLRIDWGFAKSVGVSGIFRYSFLLTLTALSALSLKSLDNVMIGSYLGEKASGIFMLGMFIAIFIETPLYSVERIAGTKIAHAFSDNNLDEIKKIYYHSVRVLFLFGGFLAICIITNIHDFLLLMPPDFRDAAGVTIILSVGSIINMATGVNSPILINSSKYLMGVVFLSVLLVVAVVLNMLLIPIYKIEGAAIATGLSSTLFNLMKFFYIWKKFGMQPYDMRSLKTILIIGVALCAGLFIPVPHNPWLAILCRGSLIAAIYGGMSYAMNIVPEYQHIFSLGFLKKK